MKKARKWKMWAVMLHGGLAWFDYRPPLTYTKRAAIADREKYLGGKGKIIRVEVRELRSRRRG